MAWFKKGLLVCISLVFFTGCSQAAHLTETAMVQMVELSVARTVAAFPSQTPYPSPTDQPTGTPTQTETPTVTFTATTIYSPRVTSTPSQGGSGLGNQSDLCDNARFVSDVTVPDGSKMYPGTIFTKIWRIQNNGTCTWTNEYSAYFVTGNKMSGTSPQQLAIQNLKPGETLDLSIDLVAPSQYGSHTGYWGLKNASNLTFGEQFYVQIQVSANAHTLTPTATLIKTTTPSPTASLVIPTATETMEPSPTATTETP